MILVVEVLAALTMGLGGELFMRCLFCPIHPVKNPFVLSCLDPVIL